MSLFTFILQESDSVNPLLSFLPLLVGLALIAALIYFVIHMLNQHAKRQTYIQGSSATVPPVATTPPPVPASGAVEYLTYSFENTADGLRQKDQYTRQIAANGYKIISEQIEQGHIKGNEQCCFALICLPAIFLAGRTPGNIIVTYARESKDESTKKCPFCAETIQKAATKCRYCGESLAGPATLPE